MISKIKKLFKWVINLKFRKINRDIALLHKCIKHKWIPIAKGEGEDEGEENCVLCKQYINHKTKECPGCPISSDTGKSGCNGTPYSIWARHHHLMHFYDDTGLQCDDCFSYAMNQVDYLMELLQKLVSQRAGLKV